MSVWEPDAMTSLGDFARLAREAATCARVTRGTHCIEIPLLPRADTTTPQSELDFQVENQPRSSWMDFVG